MISITNESDFEISSGLCLAKMWATWCGPCKRMDPIFHQLESEFGTVKFLSIDVDQFPAIAQTFRVKSLPTLLLFKNGVEIDRVVGLSPIDPLRKLLQEAIVEAHHEMISV